MPVKRKSLTEKKRARKTRKLNQQAQQRHRSLDSSRQQTLTRSNKDHTTASASTSLPNINVDPNSAEVIFQHANDSNDASNNINNGLTISNILEPSVGRPTRNSARIAAARIKTNFENNFLQDDENSQNMGQTNDRREREDESPEGRRYRCQFYQVALRERRNRQTNVQNQTQRQANQTRQVDPIAEMYRIALNIDLNENQIVQHDCGQMNFICTSCQSYNFIDEATTNERNSINRRFTKCCQKGKVVL
jgi:hypothetical protein